MTQLRPKEATRRMMALAWPAIIENLSASLVIFIDSAMVGSLGAAATAAGADQGQPDRVVFRGMDVGNRHARQRRGRRQVARLRQETPPAGTLRVIVR